MATADVIEEGATSAAVAGECNGDEEEYEGEGEVEEEEDDDDAEGMAMTAEEELVRYKDAMQKLIATTQQFQRDVEEEKRRAEEEHAEEVATLLEDLETERAQNSKLREENLVNIKAVYEQIKEYERVNEERLRAALESGNEIVESVVSVRISTQSGKPTGIAIVPRQPGEGTADGTGGIETTEEFKTRAAKDLETAMQIRVLQQQNDFLIAKLSEQKQHQCEEVEAERKVGEQAVQKIKELMASHVATLAKLEDARKEAEDARRAAAEQKREADVLRAQLRKAEAAQALVAGMPGFTSGWRKPSWDELARGMRPRNGEACRMPCVSCGPPFGPGPTSPPPRPPQSS